MFYFAILLLSTTALAEKKVYEITGTVEYFSGLYVQTNQPFTFRQLKGPDPEGYFYYLYKEHGNASWWYLGGGKKQSEITKIFKAYSWNNKVPKKDGWVSVRTYYTETFNVIGRPSVMHNLNYIKANGGSATSGGGVICVEQDSNKWILLEQDDRRICDRNKTKMG